MNVLGRAKEKSRCPGSMQTQFVIAFYHSLSWEHLFLIPVALSQVLISLVDCACYRNLTNGF